MDSESVLITIKNYRCFVDIEPVRLNLRRGVLAFVGQNNSGKSSLLRFFYEFKGLFNALRQRDTIVDLIAGRFITNYAGVEDQKEVFNDSAQRQLSIELEFPENTDSDLRRVKLFAQIESPQTWRAEYRFGPGDRKILDVIRAPAADTVQARLETINSQFVFSVASLPPMLAVLTDTLYVGPFRNAISEGGGTYYDLSIGTNFIAQWDGWKNGGAKAQSTAVQRVTEDIAAIFGYAKLEINAAQNNSKLQIVIDGRPYRLRELGAGITQFIVLLGNLAVRRPSLLLIDEPELNLHPALQARFVSRLEEYAQYGVWFATHSIGLARTAANRIEACVRVNDHAVVKPYEAVRSLPELVGEMSFSAYRDLGYDQLLLVEGVTDVKIFQQWLRMLHSDHKIVVVPLGGGQMITAGRSHELEELKRIAERVAVLIDSERSNSGEQLSAGRTGFVSDCKGLGFAVHVTDRRATDNYLPDHAIKSAFGAAISELRPYESLKTCANGWPKSEGWRAAKLMTKEELLQSDVGIFLRDILSAPRA